MLSDLYLIINFCISTFVFISIVVGGKKKIPNENKKKTTKKKGTEPLFHA